MGKTFFCQKLADELIKKGFSVKGIISYGVFKEGKKKSIIAINIATGNKIKLADFKPGWDPEKPIREWKINKAAILWGNEVLDNSVPCDVLIIDEIGFLEFEKNGGWKKVFDVVKTGLYNKAFVVIRPSLIKNALSIWGDAHVIKINTNDDVESKVQEQIYQLLKRSNKK